MAWWNTPDAKEAVSKTGAVSRDVTASDNVSIEDHLVFSAPSPSARVDLTLPDGASTPEGKEFIFADKSGEASATNPLNVNTQGSDRISGGVSVSLQSPYEGIIVRASGGHFYVVGHFAGGAQ